MSFSGLTYICKLGLVQFGSSPLKWASLRKWLASDSVLPDFLYYLWFRYFICVSDFLRDICSILCYKWGVISFVLLNFKDLPMSRWGIILRSTVRTYDISWFSLLLLLQNGSQTDPRFRFAQKTAPEKVFSSILAANKCCQSTAG